MAKSGDTNTPVWVLVLSLVFSFLILAIIIAIIVYLGKLRSGNPGSLTVTEVDVLMGVGSFAAILMVIMVICLIWALARKQKNLNIGSEYKKSPKTTVAVEPVQAVQAVQPTFIQPVQPMRQAVQPVQVMPPQYVGIQPGTGRAVGYARV